MQCPKIVQSETKTYSDCEFLLLNLSLYWYFILCQVLLQFESDALHQNNQPFLGAYQLYSFRMNHTLKCQQLSFIITSLLSIPTTQSWPSLCKVLWSRRSQQITQFDILNFLILRKRNIRIQKRQKDKMKTQIQNQNIDIDWSLN
ncbi:unnamed protein product [Paramecium octaurelia]|uniref:Transmembrane protein n=1 Tax=Paramecium octaurelia TaxID=43137 RepID=A0A8S1WI51_PAROT|nr:unnamed protein product [Paramecium octaurelia]